MSVGEMKRSVRRRESLMASQKGQKVVGNAESCRPKRCSSQCFLFLLACYKSPLQKHRRPWVLNRAGGHKVCYTVCAPPHACFVISFAVLHFLVMVALPSALTLVQHFNGLHQVALEGGERSADGGGAETMGQQAKVGEASLDAWFQAGGGTTSAERGAVLGHQVHKFLTDLPGRRDQTSKHEHHCCF